MDMRLDERDEATVARLSGRLDTAGVAAIELPFTAQLVAAAKPVLIDLTQVDFIASLGLRLLITTARARDRQGRRMALFGASAEVADILETSGVDEIIAVAPDEEAARAAIG